MSKIYWIASGKGGVGKSTVTANLAAALAASDKRVLAVDADLALRNLDLFFGMQDQVIFDIQDVCLKKCAADKAIYPVSDHRKLYFLPAPSRMEIPAPELYARMRKFLHSVESQFDYILVDCPCGTGFFQTFGDVLISPIFVATPDLTSIRDAGKVADLAALSGMEEGRLIINRLNGSRVRRGLSFDVGEIQQQVNLKLLGIVPEDPMASAYANRGILISDSRRRKISRAFFNIAARLENKETELLSL